MRGRGRRRRAAALRRRARRRAADAGGARPRVAASAELVAQRDVRAGRADHPRRATSTRRSRSPTRRPTRSRAGSARSTGARSARCIRELRAGTVNIREVPGWRTELTPFGGIGDSGLGVKEGVREAMRAMSFTKLYTLPWA